MEQRIFAQKGTTKKAVIRCMKGQVENVMIILSQKYGGSWIWVDQLKPFEGIMFDDGLTYHGFNPNTERYSTAIVNLVKP
jgi:hypothetical protein